MLPCHAFFWSKQSLLTSHAWPPVRSIWQNKIFPDYICFLNEQKWESFCSCAICWTWIVQNHRKHFNGKNPCILLSWKHSFMPILIRMNRTHWFHVILKVCDKKWITSNILSTYCPSVVFFLFDSMALVVLLPQVTSKSHLQAFLYRVHIIWHSYCSSNRAWSHLVISLLIDHHLIHIHVLCCISYRLSLEKFHQQQLAALLHT